MNVIRYNTQTGKFGFYKSKEEAGNDMPVYTSLEELENCPANTSEIAYFYNQITGEGVSRFSDKKTGLKRIWAVVSNGYDGKLNDQERVVAHKEAAEPQRVVEEHRAEIKAEGRPRPGRRPGGSSFVGKTIVPLRAVNPRRPGTNGFNSYEVIRAAGDAGVSYQDYAKKGGRSVDLRWDIDHGYAKLK